MMEMDANHDGWLTRAEASAGADRMFDQLDTNHDGRLTDADRPHMQTSDAEIGPHGTHVAPDDGNCTRTAEAAPVGMIRVTIICNGDDRRRRRRQRVERSIIVRPGDHAAPHAEAGGHVEREVTIIHRDGDDDDDMAAPEPPAAPMRRARRCRRACRTRRTRRIRRCS